MSTLHLCHWQNICHLKTHLSLLSARDSLLIFGQLSDNDKQDISHCMHGTDINWYLVIDHKNPNITATGQAHEINHEQWLALIIKHNNSYAWK